MDEKIIRSLWSGYVYERKVGAEESEDVFIGRY
jgi:hypothetical protein